jgi:hypothetical protein
MKVIDKLGKTDGTTLVLSKLPEGKIRVTSQLFAPKEASHSSLVDSPRRREGRV